MQMNSQVHKLFRWCNRKVKIIEAYYDTTQNNKLIKVGTELTVSAERGKVLIDAGVAKAIRQKNK